MILVPEQTTAIVLAGGRGTRIASRYPDLPKPLIPAAGQPFLYWVSRWLIGQGVRDIIYSTFHLGEQVEAWVASMTPRPGARLRCQRELAALGTGGGVLNCLGYCGELVLVLNGDSLVLTDISPAFERLEYDGLDGMIFGVEVPDTSRYGSLDVNERGQLIGFREKNFGQGLINVGVYLFRRHLLESFPQGVVLSIEYDILPELLEKGARIGVLTAASAPFLDIGTPETVAHASAFVREHPEYFCVALTETEANLTECSHLR